MNRHSIQMSNAIADARSARCLLARPEDAPLFIEKRFHRELQYRRSNEPFLCVRVVVFTYLFLCSLLSLFFLEFVHCHREYGCIFVIALYTADTYVFVANLSNTSLIPNSDGI